MNISVRNWHLTIVDFLVGVAVLMILSALVVPVFIPPEGRAASRSTVNNTAVRSPRH